MEEKYKRAIRKAVEGEDVAEVVYSEQLSLAEVRGVLECLQTLGGKFRANEQFAEDLASARAANDDRNEQAKAARAQTRRILGN